MVMPPLSCPKRQRVRPSCCSLLARVIGVSEPTIASVRAGRGIDPATQEGQLALLLVRVFRSLDPLVGGDEAKRIAWMHSHNKALQGVPAKLVENPEGLEATLAYLDGMRGPRFEWED